MGNSSGPRLTNVRRPKDVNTTEINGICVVIANGKGIQMPVGLKLINDRPGHYTVCPTSNMALDEFIGLLSKLPLKCQKIFKKEVV